MDEQRLTEALRGAADGGPRPSFGHADVLRASRRITMRRRSALAGSALAVPALIGVGVLTSPDGGERTDSTAASPSAAVAPPLPADSLAAPAAPPPGAPPMPEAARQADGSAEPGAATPFTGTPLGPGTAPCPNKRTDPELRILVQQALPEVTGAAPIERPGIECVPSVGDRYVELAVTDSAGVAGRIQVSYLRPGTAVSLPPGAAGAATASGGTVIVSTEAATPGAAGPFTGHLDALVSFLAPRL